MEVLDYTNRGLALGRKGGRPLPGQPATLLLIMKT